MYIGDWSSDVCSSDLGPDGTVRAAALRQIKLDDHDLGLLSYDPAFTATASCRSAITYIDGDQGLLRYRGYPIEIGRASCREREENTVCDHELRKRKKD